MTRLLLITVIAAFSIGYYTPEFIKQMEDYKKSSVCITKKMIESRVDRDQIVVIGDSCKVK